MLKDKVAIVTGGGSGIGRAIAVKYATEGASVVVADVDEPGGMETVSSISKAGSQAVFVKADTSSASDNENLVRQTIAQYGGLHIACNNAGIGGESAPVGEMPIGAWNKVIGVNLSGVFYGMRYQIPAMLKSGGGVILNMASILGMVGFANAAAYVSAKHGLLGLTKTAAIEYATQNIRVNAIGPGFIVTPLLTNRFDEASMQSIAELHPMKRMGTAEEVAELALWLSSDKSSFVTGAYYAIDGGYLAQ